MSFIYLRSGPRSTLDFDVLGYRVVGRLERRAGRSLVWTHFHHLLIGTRSSSTFLSLLVSSSLKMGIFLCWVLGKQWWMKPRKSCPITFRFWGLGNPPAAWGYCRWEANCVENPNSICCYVLIVTPYKVPFNVSYCHHGYYKILLLSWDLGHFLT